eukprot:2494795-Pyramimonas_sp.AAC.1
MRVDDGTSSADPSASSLGTSTHTARAEKCGTGLGRTERDGVCILPLHVYTDFYGLVEGLELGPGLSCGPRRPDTDLWEAIWRKIEDHGGLGEALR